MFFLFFRSAYTYSLLDQEHNCSHTDWSDIVESSGKQQRPWWTMHIQIIFKYAIH